MREMGSIDYTMEGQVDGTTLVLVVRNEEVGLKALLPKIDSSVFTRIIAVDGNSSDSTRELLSDAGVETFVQTAPGLGQAMIEGRQHVQTSAFIFFHPDGNEDAADLPRMVEMLAAGNEFVVASRMIRGAWNEEDEHKLKWRKWANQGLAVLANLLFAHGGNRTTDITNGFRGITCEAFDRMQLTSTDLTMDYQMVIRALKLGIPITEFPTHEGHRIAGDTTFPSWSTGVTELKMLWREVRMGRRRIHS